MVDYFMAIARTYSLCGGHRFGYESPVKSLARFYDEYCPRLLFIWPHS